MTRKAQPAPARSSPIATPPDFISLWEFFSECFVPFQGISLPLKDMHREICDTLQHATLGQLQQKVTAENPDGEAPFIVINIAPRIGKTKIVQGWFAWQMGFFPEGQHINTGYAGNLAELSSLYVRGVLTSQWYQEIFPEVKLGQTRKAEHWSTSAGGNLYAEGVEGELTGKGAGLKDVAGGSIAIDDAAKPNEALSATQAEKLRFWFENVLLSRRNSSTWTPIACIAQRLADEDLPGYLLKEYKDQTILIKYAALVAGHSIIPETRSTASLLKMQAANPFAFSAQYQQEPIILGGNMIRKEWFRYHDGSLLEFEEKIITVDTAMKAKQHNDFTVMQVWGRLNGKAYLLDQVREQILSPAMISVGATLFKKWNTLEAPIARMLIEEKASGPALLQSLNVLGIPALGVERLIDKVTRVEDILAFQTTGMVLFPKGEPWLAEFEAELMAFRKDGLAPRDDQVDAWADGIKHLLGSALSILDVLGTAPER